jgi:mannose-6-phosphate isomerase-like protein (cupin superfamily)
VVQTQHELVGFGPPLHIHRDAAEAFHVPEGTYLMHVEERQELCVPGTIVYVPPNVVHTFVVVRRNPGES